MVFPVSNNTILDTNYFPKYPYRILKVSKDYYTLSFCINKDVRNFKQPYIKLTNSSILPPPIYPRKHQLGRHLASLRIYVRNFHPKTPPLSLNLIIVSTLTQYQDAHYPSKTVFIPALQKNICLLSDLSFLMNWSDPSAIPPCFPEPFPNPKTKVS